MSNVTCINARRRLDNPANPLGRVYLTLRDAADWLRLEDIHSDIQERFGQSDPVPVILARLEELEAAGAGIERRAVRNGRAFRLEQPGGAA